MDKNCFHFFLSELPADQLRCLPDIHNTILGIVCIAGHQVNLIFFQQFHTEMLCLSAAFPQNTLTVYLDVCALRLQFCDPVPAFIQTFIPFRMCKHRL